MSSMYEGHAKFDREQLVFVAEAVLVGALDRLDGALPDSVDWGDRESYVNQVDNNPAELSAYERGGLETAGMTLAVLCAQLTNDGMGIYDALHVANRFDVAMQELVRGAWADKGERIKAKLAEQRKAGGSFTMSWLYGSLWPNTRAHAEKFVDSAFAEYLG